jgi:hypothetical protein
MHRRGALTADMLDEFHGFVQEELAALLEEKNAESPTSMARRSSGSSPRFGPEHWGD